MSEEVDPTTITTLKLEDLVEKYVKIRETKEELEAAMSVISGEVVIRLDAEGVKGKVVGDHTVTKTTRVTFKTTIEQAKELGAVKEAVDTAKLKSLWDAGAKIPDAQVSEYVLIKTIDQK